MPERQADRYLEVIDGPTLVFPGFCEEGIFSPTPEEIARATSQNSGYGASIISFDYVSPDAGDSVGEFPAASFVKDLFVNTIQKWEDLNSDGFHFYYIQDGPYCL